MAISLLLIIGIQESARSQCRHRGDQGDGGVIVFIALGWAYINPANFTPFIPPQHRRNRSVSDGAGILRGAGLVFFAFIGFDAVSTAAQEAKRPQKDMPIGIIGSLAVCTILYVLFAHVLTGIVNYTELNTAAPVAVAIDRTDYRWLRPAVKLAIVAGYYVGDSGDAAGTEPRVLLHVARWVAAEAVLRHSSQVPDALAVQLAVYGGYRAVRRISPRFGHSRGGNQHRHAVRIRAGMRRDYHHAPHASGACRGRSRRRSFPWCRSWGSGSTW